jgi:alkylated DNA repair dioxygenase AlkB
MDKCAAYLKPLIHEWIKTAHQVNQSVPIAHESFPTITRMNYYPSTGRIGWHADTVPGLSREAHLNIQSPIVSISLGNSAPFKYRLRMEDKASKIILQSGDVLVFGGPCRMLYHSVPEIHLKTAPSELEMHQFSDGRFNLTFREKIDVSEDEADKDSESYSNRDIMSGMHLYK